MLNFEDRLPSQTLKKGLRDGSQRTTKNNRGVFTVELHCQQV